MTTIDFAAAAQLFVSKYLFNLAAAQYALIGGLILSVLYTFVLKPLLLSLLSRKGGRRSSSAAATGPGSPVWPVDIMAAALSPNTVPSHVTAWPTSESPRRSSSSRRSRGSGALEVVGTRATLHPSSENPHPHGTEEEVEGKAPARPMSPTRAAARWISHQFSSSYPRYFDANPMAAQDPELVSVYAPRPQRWEGLYSLERRAAHLMRRANADRIYAETNITGRELEALYGTAAFGEWYTANREALVSESTSQHREHLLRRYTFHAFVVLAFIAVPAFSFTNSVAPLNVLRGPVTAEGATFLQLIARRIHTLRQVGRPGLAALVPLLSSPTRASVCLLAGNVEALVLLAAVVALVTSPWMVRRQSPAGSVTFVSFCVVLAESLAAPVEGLALRRGLGLAILAVYSFMRVIRQMK